MFNGEFVVFALTVDRRTHGVRFLIPMLIRPTRSIKVTCPTGLTVVIAVRVVRVADHPTKITGLKRNVSSAVSHTATGGGAFSLRPHNTPL